jgi:hypothetical protein
MRVWAGGGRGRGRGPGLSVDGERRLGEKVVVVVMARMMMMMMGGKVGGKEKDKLEGRAKARGRREKKGTT